tara:strand:- start:2965 stop:4944 length:1980 start_codon:yes stop_codon:yes gene_type:complete
MNYRSEIDGLRALAVLPVIIFHAGLQWFSGGFVGVDIFFVISGYLITNIIISEMAEDSFSLKNFYERRARRILPALFFVTVVCMPFAWMWLAPSDLKDFGNSVASVGIFTSNIFFWSELGYFGPTAELQPLLHTWSLAVEEQYYILFPVFLMITWRLGLNWVLILLAIIFIISLCTAHWATTIASHPKMISGAFFLLPTRGWELLIGVFIAFYLKHFKFPKSFTFNQIVSFIGLGMILFSIIYFDERTPFPSLYALVPTLGTCLIILSAVPNTIVSKILSFRPLVGIGLISYSAYLWHNPLLVFARHRFMGELTEGIIIMLCIASILLAYFSWRFVEKPFRDKNKTSRKMIFGLFISGLILFQFIGFFSYKTYLANGYSSRVEFSDQTKESLIMSDAGNCFNTVLNHTADNWGCRLGIQKDKIDYILFGDSHSLALKNLIDKAAKFNEISVFFTGSNGCVPFLDIHPQRSDQLSNNCNELNTRVSQFAELENIRGIILSARWTFYTNGNYEGGRQQFIAQSPKGPFNKKESISTFQIGFNKTVDYYNNKQIPIFLVSQPPQQKYPAELAYFQLYKGVNNLQNISIKRDEFETFESLYKSIILDRINDINYINLTDKFCGTDICPIGSEEQSFYSDTNHLSIVGADRLYSMFSKILASQN